MSRIDKCLWPGYEKEMTQRIKNYNYDDIADPDRVTIKPKGPWIKENKMKWTVIVEAPEGVKPKAVWGRNDYTQTDYALQIVKWWPYEAKENKMTKEEAVVKITIIEKRGGSLIDQLEELGLIKFEKKKLTPTELIMKHQDSKDFVIALDNYGYKIIPK